MRKTLAAALGAAMTMNVVAPAMASDFFNRNTMLGWRQQTGPSAMAYFRAPLGPTTVNAPVRAGLALTGPRAYGGGDAPAFSQAPRMIDFSLVNTGTKTQWNAQFNIGNAVAWTNADPKTLPAGQHNFMESGLSWVAVGAITVGIAAATMGFIEKD